MTWSRRSFVKHTASCAAHLGLMAAASPWLTRALWAAQERFPVVAREPWGRLERVAEGVWAPGQSFEAERVLAKHDENYMPREVSEALKRRGDWRGKVDGS